MNKFILSVALMLFAVTATAQTQEQKRDFFCMVSPDAPLHSTTTASVIWSNSRKKSELVDDKGEEIIFSSIVDILNFMAERGWEYVEKIDESKAYIFLMKKKAGTETEAKSGLNFKGENKK